MKKEEFYQEVLKAYSYQDFDKEKLVIPMRGWHLGYEDEIIAEMLQKNPSLRFVSVETPWGWRWRGWAWDSEGITKAFVYLPWEALAAIPQGKELAYLMGRLDSVRLHGEEFRCPHMSGAIKLADSMTRRMVRGRGNQSPVYYCVDCGKIL